jgi:hypothetical protein
MKAKNGLPEGLLNAFLKEGFDKEKKGNHKCCCPRGSYPCFRALLNRLRGPQLESLSNPPCKKCESKKVQNVRERPYQQVLERV